MEHVFERMLVQIQIRDFIFKISQERKRCSQKFNSIDKTNFIIKLRPKT